MIKKLLITGLVGLSVFTTSCKSDDDNTKTLSVEEQNIADDAAITNFLANYYFDDLGKITKFSDAVTSNDKTPLSKIAQQDAAGYWYVINPDAPAGSGTSPDGENNILIHYNLKYFVATEGGNGYTSLTTGSSSIEGLGVAQENPFFYKQPVDTTKEKSYYVVDNLVNGLKKFKPTNKGKNDPYDHLQGVIVVPSRLAYGRNSNALGVSNATLLLNFELYKVCPEGETCQ